MIALFKKLDLLDFISHFSSLFAREKPIHMDGDINVHYRFIKELEGLEFSAPKSVANLDTELVHLSKFGTLKLYEIYEFVKIIRYFLYLKSLKTESETLNGWLASIVIPEAVIKIEALFDIEPKIKQGINEQLDSLSEALKANKAQISRQLHQLLSSQKLSGYLVDRQIHYINGEEALLVRGGFNHAIKAQVIGRSSGGFFYVLPESIDTLKRRESEILSAQEELIYQLCRDISAALNKNLLFLKFINKEFDRFDHYQARINFARLNNYEFVFPKRDKKIVLEGFAHPALDKPKLLSLDFSKNILMVTGVNAGGKTMLLKSILACALLSKYLIPFKIDSSKSHIGHFKEIEAIIEDPQNVKNDISTFAGRMALFSELFGKREALVGVDEIELGTDSDEAASLFKVILERLVEREQKIIITTHHKRLAALMAGHPQVELLAALYDEERQVPTFSFLKGTIGKSYAFETAERYGIPRHIVKEAKIIYGEDKERLNELIERSSELEFELKRKRDELEGELEKAKRVRISLEDEKELRESEFKKVKHTLELEYKEAIEAAKKAAKESESKEIHRVITKAHTLLPKEQEPKIAYEFKIGDSVKSGKTKGVVVALSANSATIETSEGIKLKLPKSSLRLSGELPKEPIKSPKFIVENPKYASVTLDLHGLRAEEACERLDKFLSDALIAGFDEVLVYHGIGTGKLSFAVKQFLLSHPKVREFGDAPYNMGGFGAKLVKL